jgi:hypothetical protein
MVHRNEKSQILRFIKAIHEHKYNSARTAIDNIINSKLKRKISAQKGINIFK